MGLDLQKLVLQWKAQLKFINFISPSAMKFRVIKPPRNIWDGEQKASIRALCFNLSFLGLFLFSWGFLGVFFRFFFLLLSFIFFKAYQLKQNPYISIKISTGLCLLAVNLKLHRI